MFIHCIDHANCLLLYRCINENRCILCLGGEKSSKGIDFFKIHKVYIGCGFNNFDTHFESNLLLKIVDSMMFNTGQHTQSSSVQHHSQQWSDFYCGMQLSPSLDIASSTFTLNEILSHYGAKDEQQPHFWI